MKAWVFEYPISERTPDSRNIIPGTIQKARVIYKVLLTLMLLK